MWSAKWRNVTQNEGFQTLRALHGNNAFIFRHTAAFIARFAFKSQTISSMGGRYIVCDVRCSCLLNAIQLQIAQSWINEWTFCVYSDEARRATIFLTICRFVFVWNYYYCTSTLNHNCWYFYISLLPSTEQNQWVNTDVYVSDNCLSMVDWFVHLAHIIYMIH